jgi:hypothetical protein
LGDDPSQPNKKMHANKTMDRRRNGLTILSQCFPAQQAFI